LGAVDASGRRHAFYEPIHGSAPDIAGKGLANPLAQILSLELLLSYSFDMLEDAALIEQAVENVLATAGRTADIAAPGRAKISTSEMGDAVLAELRRLG
jgi:3-isopropylmalate dehydrogenase